MKRKKSKPVKTLKKECDKIFSQFIRIRDSDYRGYVECITCGKMVNFKYECDAGHFQPREHNITRYHEQNVNGQCKRCNNKNWGGGKQYEHGLAIDKKYGKGTADSLVELAKQHKQFTPYELVELIGIYKEKVKSLPNYTFFVGDISYAEMDSQG